jgi:peptidyl-prolyl cis-trans isomerase SurA
VLIALEPAPTPANDPNPTSARAAASTPAPPQAAPRRDPEIIRTSAKPAADGPSGRRRVALPPGCPIARVGDEIITYHDIEHAIRDNISKLSVPRGFDTAGQMELLNYVNKVKIDILESLIDRSLLAQEAKRNISDPKMLARINEEADKIFHDNEIVPLERKHNVKTEEQLKERLAASGRSLDAMRQSFRQMFLAESFIQQKLRDKVSVELPDLLKYYNEHVSKHEFDRPALIRWRELVVEVGQHESREAARRKANDLLEALKRGGHLATLARTQSEGPAASRNRGGLMETSPGGYSVVPVNDALVSLPIGHTSGVIEGPQSFHIVKVESRRGAGPASFEEVQDQIKPIVQNEKIRLARTEFISKLRRKTMITVYSAKKRAEARN